MDYNDHPCLGLVGAYVDKRNMTDAEIEALRQQRMDRYYRWVNDPEAQKRYQEARMNASTLRDSK